MSIPSENENEHETTSVATAAEPLTPAGLADQAIADYRVLVVQLADGRPAAPEQTRRTLLLAGRSAVDLAADVERVQRRRQAAADLEAAAKLDSEADAIKPQLDEATAGLERITAAAQAEYEEMVRKAAQRRDTRIARARETAQRLHEQHSDVTRRAAAVRHGRQELLETTADAAIDAEVERLRRQRPDGGEVLLLSLQSPEAMARKANELEARAQRTDRAVDAYENVHMSAETRIKAVASEFREVDMSGANLSNVWVATFPAWIGKGTVRCPAGQFPVKFTAATARRGRVEAEQLREEAAALRAQIDDVEAAKEQAPAIEAEQIRIDARIEAAQRQRLDPDRFGLTGEAAPAPASRNGCNGAAGAKGRYW